MKKIIFIFLFLIFAVFSSAKAGQCPPIGDTLKITVINEFPHWSEGNSQEELKGFNIDLSREICKRLGKKCKFLIKPFGETTKAVRFCTADISVVGVSPLSVNSKVVNLTTPYAVPPAYFTYKKGNKKAEEFCQMLKPETNLDKEQDLESFVKQLQSSNLNFVAANGTDSSVFLSKIDNINYERVVDTKLLSAIQNGIADLALGPTGAEKGRAAEMPDLEVCPNKLIGGAYGQGVSMEISLLNQSLLNDVNNIILDLVEEGVLKFLSNTNFGEDISPK